MRTTLRRAEKSDVNHGMVGSPTHFSKASMTPQFFVQKPFPGCGDHYRRQNERNIETDPSQQSGRPACLEKDSDRYTRYDDQRNHCDRVPGGVEHALTKLSVAQ